MDPEAGRLTSALRTIAERPMLLLPVALVAVLGELAVTLSTVVHAWTAPTLLRDGVFTFAEPSTPAVVTNFVASVLLAVATVAALGVTSLLTAMNELERDLDVRNALREVRRRWGPVLVWSALLLVGVIVITVVIPALALSALEPEDTPLIIVPAGLVLLILGAPVARLFPVVLIQRTGTIAAWRYVRTQRDTLLARRLYRSVVGLLLLVAVLSTITLWLIGRIPNDLGHPTVDALDSLTQVIVSTIALTSFTVGLTRVHVNATFAVTKIVERDALTWAGLNDAAQTPAPSPAPAPAETHAEAEAEPESTTTEDLEPTPVPARAWPMWTAVAVTWTVAPLTIVTVVATNPTPAIEPIAVEYGISLINAVPIPAEDGIAIVAHGPQMTVCTAADGCDTRFGYDDLEPSVAAADPTGPGIVVFGVTGELATAEYVLVSCDVTTCRHPDERATQVVLAEAELEHLPWLSAVAATNGAYAVIHPSRGLDDAELLLTRCDTAACRDPRTSSLGAAAPGDVVRAAFGLDGTLWALQTMVAENAVRLRSVAPGSTSPVEALTFEMPAHSGFGFWFEGELQPVVELAVRDDGTPVVLYRDTNDGALMLVSCNDTTCTDTTRNRLPVEPWDLQAAQLAVDATGRPLVTTSGDGIRLHSCTDRACTSTRTGLVSLGRAPSFVSGLITSPFMTLDEQDRPVFLLEPDYARPELLFCTEARCGL